MKFTLSWLKEFVTFKAAPKKLAEMLTMAGLEVESVTAVRDPETEREDFVFEIAVTPNRGDCLGIAGLAREVSALSGGRLTSRAPGINTKDSSISKRVSVAIESPRLCRRYSAAVVDGIRIGPSPARMRFRLESCGFRSINNVVDTTNYVMLETGQPLHAFDVDRLSNREIVVRPAKEIKKFTTLDGVERILAPEDLLICDRDTPVALAGVMGGADSEVTADTRSLLLESANFDPSAIRRTAKRLGLHSEASHRFERGVDPEGTVAALDRAVKLLNEVAMATPVRGVVDRYPRPPRILTLSLREEHVEKLLGVPIAAGRAEKLLRSLGLKTRRQARSGGIRVTVPANRSDLTRQADLIEELARLHGYEKIPLTLPLSRSSGGKTDPCLGHERKIRAFLAGQGLVEVINLPFATERLNRYFRGLWEGSPLPVAVLNPLVKQYSEMRLSLIPGLLENLQLNLAQKALSFCAYHLGKVYRLGPDGETEERQCLGGLLFGPRERKGLRRGNEAPLGFLDCRGLVEGILDTLRIGERTTWNPEATGVLHPGRAASIDCDGKKFGHLGQIHPDIGEELGLPPFSILELDFEGLLQYAPRRITVRPLPRFPSVERDFAIVVDQGLPAQQIVSWVNGLGENLIEHVEVFDQYVGAPIPPGKKSLAYKVSYRADDRTLTDTEVNALHQKLVGRISEVFDAQLRS